MRPDLPHKLGLKKGLRVYLINAPRSFARDLTEASPQVDLSTSLRNEPADVIIAWPGRGLSQMLQGFLRVLEPDGAIWIVIPKKASGSAGPSFQSLLNIALPMGPGRQQVPDPIRDRTRSPIHDPAQAQADQHSRAGDRLMMTQRSSSVVPAAFSVIPALFPVIPAEAGIQRGGEIASSLPPFNDEEEAARNCTKKRR